MAKLNSGTRIYGNVTIDTFATATGNITGGNILTAGLVSATGNVTGGNVRTGGLISATGAVTAASVVGGVITGTSVSVTGNITTSGQLTLTNASDYNLYASGAGDNFMQGALGVGALPAASTVTLVGSNPATGATTVNNILLNSDIQSDVTSTYNSYNSNPATAATAFTLTNLRHFSAGQRTLGAGSTVTNQVGFYALSTLTGATNNYGFQSAIASGTGRFNFYASGTANNYFAGNVGIGTTTPGFPLTVSGEASVSGNITGGNLRTAGLISATGAITGTSLTVSTGNITGGNIVNANGNGVGNIGSSTTYFNTVFAKATSAQYADVAEKYTADADYPVGTVLRIGGIHEVSQTNSYHATNIVGTVSDKPAYVMNSGLAAEHVAVVALLGRVPCRVTGTISKGDLLVSSKILGVAAVLDPDLWAPGCVIGKALEDYDGNSEGVIEIVVGRS